jgi:hypothetical protein
MCFAGVANGFAGDEMCFAGVASGFAGVVIAFVCVAIGNVYCTFSNLCSVIGKVCIANALFRWARFALQLGSVQAPARQRGFCLWFSLLRAHVANVR